MGEAFLHNKSGNNGSIYSTLKDAVKWEDLGSNIPSSAFITDNIGDYTNSPRNFICANGDLLYTIGRVLYAVRGNTTNTVYTAISTNYYGFVSVEGGVFIEMNSATSSESPQHIPFYNFSTGLVEQININTNMAYIVGIQRVSTGAYLTLWDGSGRGKKISFFDYTTHTIVDKCTLETGMLTYYGIEWRYSDLNTIICAYTNHENNDSDTKLYYFDIATETLKSTITPNGVQNLFHVLVKCDNGFFISKDMDGTANSGSLYFVNFVGKTITKIDDNGIDHAVIYDGTNSALISGYDIVSTTRGNYLISINKHTGVITNLVGTDSSNRFKSIGVVGSEAFINYYNTLGYLYRWSDENLNWINLAPSFELESGSSFGNGTRFRLAKTNEGAWILANTEICYFKSSNKSLTLKIKSNGIDKSPSCVLPNGNLIYVSAISGANNEVCTFSSISCTDFTIKNYSSVFGDYSSTHNRITQIFPVLSGQKVVIQALTMLYILDLASSTIKYIGTCQKTNNWYSDFKDIAIQWEWTNSNSLYIGNRAYIYDFRHMKTGYAFNFGYSNIDKSLLHVRTDF